ncbi:MAG: hypothetical protein ACRD3T_20330, partial [Terriglobia bacterium]
MSSATKPSMAHPQPVEQKEKKPDTAIRFPTGAVVKFQISALEFYYGPKKVLMDISLSIPEKT